MLQQLGERLALDELHDQEVAAVRLLHAEQRRDVRMVERGEHLGFTLESDDAIRVRVKRLWQDLHGDIAAKP